LNNSDLIAHAFEEAGVRWVFGVPSGPVLPLIEALHRSSVQFVLTASETSAGFMASAVGYLTGIPGVCASTVGPGATNLTTGVGCAWLDRLPVLAVTCNVPSAWLERRIQMRVDHHELFRPLSKASLSLRADTVAPSIEKALALAKQEPPGPVHLDLPEDVALADAVECSKAKSSPAVLPDCSTEIVRIVEDSLRVSRRPLVITGLFFTRSRAGH